MKNILKKLGCILLTMVLLTSMISSVSMVAEAATSQTISKALKTKTYKSVPTYTKSTCYLPDFCAFTDYYAYLENRDRPDDSSTILSETWRIFEPDIAREITEKYVALLQDERFHLKVVSQINESDYLCYELCYTGKGKVSAISGDFDEQPYHVRITFKNYNKVYIYYSKQFQIVDTLDRMDGSTAKNETIKGTSARKAILKNKDGYYQTSDKRLSTKTGYADVIVNGKHCKKKVTFSSNMSATYDFIKIDSVWEQKNIEMYFVHDSTKTGDLYNRADTMLYDEAPRTYFKIVNTKENVVYSTNYFNYITMRTAQWNLNGVTVVYFAAKNRESDENTYTIEGLIATKYTDPLASKGELVTMKKGKTLSLRYDDVEFVPNYELYHWQILSGEDIVSLSGTKSRICKIKAKKKGTAVIRIIYEYGKDKPDVLTGINRNVNRTKTQIYRIKVTS